MSKYFLLSWSRIPEVASAFAPEGKNVSYKLIAELEGLDQLPFELELIKLKEVKSGLIKSGDISDLKEWWIDFQPNNLAWPLMSEKLKRTVSAALTGIEGISWVEAIVRAGQEKRPYYIPRFSFKLDVLDTERTKFVPGSDQIMLPFFSIKKIDKYSLFVKPATGDLWKISSSIYLNEALKKAIEKEKLTGMIFEKALVG